MRTEFTHGPSLRSKRAVRPSVFLRGPAANGIFELAAYCPFHPTAALTASMCSSPVSSPSMNLRLASSTAAERTTPSKRTLPRAKSTAAFRLTRSSSLILGFEYVAMASSGSKRDSLHHFTRLVHLIPKKIINWREFIRSEIGPAKEVLPCPVDCRTADRTCLQHAQRRAG